MFCSFIFLQLLAYYLVHSRHSVHNLCEKENVCGGPSKNPYSSRGDSAYYNVKFCTKGATKYSVGLGVRQESKLDQKYLGFGGRNLKIQKTWKERRKVIHGQRLMLLFSYSVMSDSLQHRGLQHTRPPCPSPSLRVCSNSRPLSR